ncbi:MAG: hypothetical protein ACPL3B_01970 [Fervidobacterium sp.]
MVKKEFRERLNNLKLGYEPRIVIGISTQEKILTSFAVQLMRIRDLYDDIIEDIIFSFEKPVNVSRNTVMTKFLVEHPYATHLLILDDDVFVPEDFLISLLEAQAAANCMMSSGFLVKKDPPHYPQMCVKMSPGAYAPITDWSGRYIIVDVLGFGCLLIFRRVLQDIPYPFCVSDVQSEDYYFFSKCSVYGYKVVVDTELVCGHIGYYVYTKDDFQKYHNIVKASGVQVIRQD